MQTNEVVTRERPKVDRVACPWLIKFSVTRDRFTQARAIVVRLWLMFKPWPNWRRRHPGACSEPAAYFVCKTRSSAVIDMGSTAHAAVVQRANEMVCIATGCLRMKLSLSDE